MKHENTDIIAAVARLERQLRTVKLTLGIVLLGIAGMALTAWVAPQGDTISAKQFMVLDSDGIPRGMFGVLADQATIGMMYTDPSGNQRIVMSVDPSGRPALSFMDEGGIVRSEIGMGDDGSPWIVLNDASEVSHIALSATNEGAGQVTFFGNPAADTLPPPQRAMVGTFGNGQPAIMFYDRSESVRASLNMSLNGAAQWRFYGPDGGTERAVLGVFGDGQPMVRLADSTGMSTFLRIGGMLPDTTVVPATEGN
jgi:hypothetical protein